MWRSLRFLMLVVGLVVALAPSGEPLAQPASPLVVRFLDVAQGDGAWLTTPGGQTVLIDCGRTGYGLQLVARLQAAGVTRINVLAPSHAHADHMGGCIRVLDEFPVDSILLTGQTDDSATWKLFTAKILQHAIPVTPIVAGQQFDWGGVRATVYNPRSHADFSLFDEYADCHAILVEHGSVRFLFVGDLHQSGETRALAAGLPSAQILKVAEHGGNAGSSDDFLARVLPELAVISASAQNAYGHPHTAVTNRLEAAGATIMETSVNGTITITSDGSDYTIGVERGAPPSMTDEDGCDTAYPDFCLPPPPPDLNCSSPELTGRNGFAVLAPDPHRLDP